MGARSAARILLPSSSLPVSPLRVPVSGTPHVVVVPVVAVPPVALLLVVAAAVEVTAAVASLLPESVVVGCCRRSPIGFVRLLRCFRLLSLSEPVVRFDSAVGCFPMLPVLNCFVASGSAVACLT